jgi:hypothetical protein
MARLIIIAEAAMSKRRRAAAEPWQAANPA